MSVKIRLQRHGRKQAPYYHIVVADSRAPRDGKFIENLGFYKPQTVPATIELDLDKAVKWLENGAQPTDTCRAILSYKGVLMKKHLNGGVRKGVLTQEQADAKFEKWVEEKNAKVAAHVAKQGAGADAKIVEKLVAEAKVKEARAAKLAEKKAALIAEAEAANAPVVEETPEVAEIPAEEAVIETSSEAVNDTAAETAE
ncbi:MAG: 30S ribosomal protein S16 [Bacteroidetes bacterium]|nr:30S ribosomal protein S16 [Bacteroidota bacterium]